MPGPRYLLSRSGKGRKQRNETRHYRQRASEHVERALDSLQHSLGSSVLSYDAHRGPGRSELLIIPVSEMRKLRFQSAKSLACHPQDFPVDSETARQAGRLRLMRPPRNFAVRKPRKTLPADLHHACRGLVGLGCSCPCGGGDPSRVQLQLPVDPRG